MAQRPDPEPDEAPGAKAAAIILFATALLTLGRVTVLRPWIPTEASPGFAYGGAFFIAMLGVALLQGSRVARWFVVGATWLFTLLVLAGAAMALEKMSSAVAVTVGLVALAVILPPALAITGLLLGEDPSRARVVACVGVLAIYGLGSFGFEMWIWHTLERRVRLQIAASAAAEPEFDEPALGLKISPPEGWVLLRKDNPLWLGEPGRASLAHAHSNAVASLRVDEHKAGTASLESSVQSFVAGLQQVPELSGVAELGRAEIAVGGVAARRTSFGMRDKRDPREMRLTSISWQDRYRFFRLDVRFPMARAAEAEAGVSQLLKGISFQPVLSQQFRDLMQQVAALTPHLSPGAVETILGRYPDKQLAPSELFRLAYLWSSRGVKDLTPQETAELGQVTTLVFAALTPRDRARLGEYLERVRIERPTTPTEDREMSAIMKLGTDKLPPESLQKLQTLIEKALSISMLLTR